MAVCRIVGGSCVVDCINVPPAVQNALQARGRQDALVSEWLIKSIAGPQDLGRANDPIFMQALFQGVYLDAQLTEIARFTLPATRTGGSTVSAAG